MLLTFLGVNEFVITKIRPRKLEKGMICYPVALIVSWKAFALFWDVHLIVFSYAC